MKLTDFIHRRLTWVLEAAESRDRLLHDLCERIAADPGASGLPAERLYQALLEREAKGSTATPEGVALPHAMVEGAHESFLAAALVRGGVDFRTDRAGAVDLVFLLVGPADSAWQHLRLLARLARICHTPGALQRLRAARDDQDLYQRLVEEDARHV